MAAHSPNFIRLRLFFDYPPPAVVGCRLCWLLVDLNSCRVVADLESIIRDKFEFSRGSILSLFVEDCYLPHTESVFVVRDNDTIRVKVDCLTLVNGHSICPDAAAETCRKRQRATEEDGSGDERVSTHCKKKKKKKRNESSADGSHLVTTVNKNETPQGKRRKKKKKKKTEANSHGANTPTPAAPPHKKSLGVNKATKSFKNIPTTRVQGQNAPMSVSVGVSKENKTSGSKSTSTLTSTPTASKAKPKPTQTPAPPSSSDTDSSSDEAVEVSPKPNRLTPTTTTTSPEAASTTKSTNSSQKPTDRAVQPPAHTRTEPHNQKNMQPHIRHQQHTQSTAGLWGGISSRQDGVLAAAGPGDRWKSKGDDQGERSCRDLKETSYQTDSLSNVSIVVQNGAESVAQKDYSTMPLLAAPPQVGQTIAFKLLELTENYTPEISEYKEGKIVGFDPTTEHLELELLNASQEAPVEPGKFDLVYQNPDGSETVEYALPRGSWVTERWASLLEPRLII
ncbi:coilin [Nematolebias whitei]|uniref:coilin n=1 Tax=Nematolebias whitei TaxID=451745 RepID=UPI00189A926A|nr:coilin [Nematolebias whitei]